MKTCPRCSTAVQDGVSFCPSCGSGILATPGLPSPPAGTMAPGSYAGAPQTSGKAIGSLICGIVSMVILPFFASIPAVILGHISLSEIRKGAGRLQGKGMALAGLIMGYFSVAFIPIILIIAAIAIPNLLRAKMAANEASAVGALRMYNMAIMSYASRCPGVGFPASVRDLGPGSGDCQGGTSLVDSILAQPETTRNGYHFSYSPGSTDSNGRVVSYTLTADPVAENATGVRHFFLDESGVIRYASGIPANPASPALQ
ncbi:MAG TPA: DUF4190 domain-containing protein [Candidatus Acidoferrum sp.]|nr:DUF4190 domain-containing protein [Candidatus Acidoferrum sp.]